jgi:hypothetical protein
VKANPRKTRALNVIAIALALIIGGALTFFLWFFRAQATNGKPNDVSDANRFFSESSRSRDKRHEPVTASEAAGNPQTQAIVAKFDRKLLDLKQITGQIETKTLSLGETGKRVVAAVMFGRDYSNAVVERYADSEEERGRLFGSNLAGLESIRATQKDLMFPTTLIAAFESSEPIPDADMTVGELVEDLFQNTDYIDLVKERLGRIAEKHPAHENALKRLVESAEPKDFLEQLRILAPELRIQFDRSLDQFLPPVPSNVRHRAFLADMFFAATISNVAGSYQRSWLRELDDLQLKERQVVSELLQMIQTLPKDSAERMSLAQAFADYQLEAMSSPIYATPNNNTKQTQTTAQPNTP